MRTDFSCETSKMVWELYSLTHELGLLSLYINLEHGIEKTDENIHNDSQDMGMEL